MKKFFNKHREVVMYLVFGIFTTLIALAAYYCTFLFSEHVLGFDLSDKKSMLYVGVYMTAQVLQWCVAVLFSFYTNKKWVFVQANPDVSTKKQLLMFASGRVVTFFLDSGLTYIGILAFERVMQGENMLISIGKFSLEMDAEFFTKIIVSVVTVVSNYVISKLFIFRKKKAES